MPIHPYLVQRPPGALHLRWLHRRGYDVVVLRLLRVGGEVGVEPPQDLGERDGPQLDGVDGLVREARVEEPPVDFQGPANHPAGAEAGLGVGAVHLEGFGACVLCVLGEESVL